MWKQRPTKPTVVFCMTTKSPGGAPYRHMGQRRDRFLTHGRARSMNPCFGTIQTSGDTQGFGELGAFTARRKYHCRAIDEPTVDTSACILMDLFAASSVSDWFVALRVCHGVQYHPWSQLSTCRCGILGAKLNVLQRTLCSTRKGQKNTVKTLFCSQRC